MKTFYIKDADVILRTNGSWITTELIINGIKENLVTKIDIFVGYKLVGRIEVPHRFIGCIDNISTADLVIERYCSSNNKDIKISKTGKLIKEKIVIKNANIQKL